MSEYITDERLISCHFTLGELEHLSAVLTYVAEEWLKADPSHENVGATHCMLQDMLNDLIAIEYDAREASRTDRYEGFTVLG